MPGNVKGGLLHERWREIEECDVIKENGEER